MKRDEYVAFWRTLLVRSRGQTHLFSGVRSPNHGNQLATGMGRTGLLLMYVIRGEIGGVRLYIDFDRSSGTRNKEIFDALLEERSTIEEEFGGPLEWARLNGVRWSYVTAQ